MFILTENTFLVFPNPSNGNLTVDIKEATNCIFEIYNVIGEKIFQLPIENSITKTEVSAPNGIYYYEIKSETKLIGKGNLVIQN